MRIVIQINLEMLEIQIKSRSDKILSLMLLKSVFDKNLWYWFSVKDLEESLKRTLQMYQIKLHQKILGIAISNYIYIHFFCILNKINKISRYNSDLVFPAFLQNLILIWKTYKTGYEIYNKHVQFKIGKVKTKKMLYLCKLESSLLANNILGIFLEFLNFTPMF